MEHPNRKMSNTNQLDDSVSKTIESLEVEKNIIWSLKKKPEDLQNNFLSKRDLIFKKIIIIKFFCLSL